MCFDLLKAATRSLALLCLFLCTVGHAQIPFQEVHTVADSTHAVPVEHSLDITVAGTYQVSLADLGAPSAPLASVKLAITQGNTLVGTPLTGAGSVQFDASVGTYVIHVVGALGPNPGSGPIGITVTDVSTNNLFASFSDTLGLPPTGVPNNTGVIDDTFTVPSDGQYVVTLSDLQLPQTLPTLTLLITKSVDSTLVTNPPLTAPGSTTVTLQQGVSYSVFGWGQADANVGAGLFSAVVAPAGGSGAAVYSKVVPVGKVGSAQPVTLTSGTSYTLTLADLGVPSPLASLAAAVTLNGQSVVSLAAKGTSTAFAATSGTYSVFSMGSAATSGSYAVSVAPQGGGSAALSYARAVAASGTSTYNYDTAAVSAGSYVLNLSDLAVPSLFSSLTAVAVQAGAPLGTPLTGTSNQTVTAAAGPVSLLVFAQPATTANSPGGLFDIALTASGGGSPAFETTQGVGQLFSARQISITTPGSYAVNVSDLSFPAQLSTLAVIVTQGSNRVGSIYTGGAFAFTATPGNYFINFIAQPSGTDGAGTYALSVAAGPTLDLQSNASTVTSGATVTLTWSTQNATACTATDGWSGSQMANGTFTTPALTAATTFTLTCTGEGVSVNKSVMVSVQAPPPSSGGHGGGALGAESLIALGGLLLLRRRGRHAPSERSKS